ncbi:fucose isomerase, partial [Singulisphaera rosea]
STGRIGYDSSEIHGAAALGAEALKVADSVLQQIRRKRILALMLGDTSMGMINGYFGPRLLYPIGFSEHKVDQAWLVERTRSVADTRVNDAFKFVQDKGVTFHWGEADAEDFTPEATKEQLRSYLAVLDLLEEFHADCLGWQYQLGLLKLLPPSDFSEGLLNSHARPEGNGHVVITSTEADQGNLVPMEMMKRILEAKGEPGAVMFHDVRWGGEHEGRWLWVLLNSGSCGAYAFNKDVSTLKGVHSYRQPSGYFPVPGGTFAGESLPGPITWARAWID